MFDVLLDSLSCSTMFASSDIFGRFLFFATLQSFLSIMSLLCYVTLHFMESRRRRLFGSIPLVSCSCLALLLFVVGFFLSGGADLLWLDDRAMMKRMQGFFSVCWIALDILGNVSNIDTGPACIYYARDSNDLLAGITLSRWSHSCYPLSLAQFRGQGKGACGGGDGVGRTDGKAHAGFICLHRDSCSRKRVHGDTPPLYHPRTTLTCY